MRATGLFLVVVLLTGCTTWKQKSPSFSNATGAEAMERSFWKAVKDKAWKEVEKQLAPTFVALTPQGTFDRAAWMAELKKLEVSDYSLGEIDVRPNNADMTITYTLSLRGSVAGAPIPSAPVRVMTVWQEMNGKWLAIAHSVLPAPSAP